MARRKKNRIKGIQTDDANQEQPKVVGDLFVLLYDIAERRSFESNTPDFIQEIVDIKNVSQK